MLARVAVATALVALAAAPPADAAGGGKPTGHELWRAYPLAATASATASQSATGGAARGGTPRRAATPSPAPDRRGGGAPWLPIGLVILAAAAAAGLALRRRRAPDATAPAETAASAPASAVPVPQAGARTGRFRPRAPAERSRRFTPSARPPARPADRPAHRFEPSSPGPVRDARTAERLRAAVDMQRGREWPWPEGSDGLWRCEIGPDQAALSARFRAVLHPPDGEPPRVLGVSSAGPASGDWQSAAPLEQAVNGLAAQLVADGWEPVEGTGDAYTRRFCWRHDAAPHVHLEETAWSA
jgi:hypothetical protein